MTSLFPGYKQVEAFGPDEEYEEEVEECFLTFDLDDVDPALIPNSETYRLIGLDTPTPFLQLSGTILKGRPQTLLGTQLVFEKVDGENDDDIEGSNHGAAHPASQPPPPPPPPPSELGANRDVRVRAEVVHVCSTQQRIRFKEVKLKAKSTQSPAGPSTGSGVQFRHQDEGGAQRGLDGGNVGPKSPVEQQTMVVQENLGDQGLSGMDMEVDTETS